MNHNEQLPSSKSKNSLPFDNTPSISIERTFDASVERVWRAWSEPELIKQWWGPSGFSTPTVKMNFRVGGQYTFAMKSPEGFISYSSGTYEKITPLKKIVCSDYFSDEFGKAISAKEAGMTTGEWPNFMYITVELKNAPEGTRMTVTHEGIPKSEHIACIDGWSSSFDRLQRLVERN